MAAHLGQRGERQQRQRRVQAGQSPNGVPGLGERDQRLGVEPFADIAGGVADHSALGARDVRQRRGGRRILFDGADDPGHRLDCGQWVLTDRGFAGQHDRVGAVEHGVRDVGSLSPGRTRVLDHRFEHLGRHDHGFGVLPCHLDGALLNQRYLFQRQLDTQVTPGDHHRIESQHNRFEVVDGLWLLEFGDDRHPPADPIHHLVNQLDIRRRTDERQRHHVDAQMHGELEIVDILFGQRRRRDTHPGQRHSLVVADRAALSNPAHDVVAVDVIDHQTDVAVVDQNTVTGQRILGQLLVGGRHPVVVAGAIRNCDPHQFAVSPVRRAVSETAEPDLGALEVGEHADGTPSGVRGGPHPVVGRFVVAVVAMAEVHSGDVHSGFDQRQDRLIRAGGRTESTDDLSASCHDK